MAWDENVCANSPAPEFDIPADKTLKELFLEAMGWEEIPISAIDSEGQDATVLVVGRTVE